MATEVPQYDPTNETLSRYHERLKDFMFMLNRRDHEFFLELLNSILDRSKETAFKLLSDVKKQKLSQFSFYDHQSNREIIRFLTLTRAPPEVRERVLPTLTTGTIERFYRRLPEIIEHQKLRLPKVIDEPAVIKVLGQLLKKLHYRIFVWDKKLKLESGEWRIEPHFTITKDTR